MPEPDPRFTPMPDARLAEVDAEIGHPYPYSHGLAGDGLVAMAHEMRAEIKRLRGIEAMLTDLVVTAAAVIFEEIPPGSEMDYATECLHTAAVELVAANPRLAGAYRGGA